MRKLNKRKLYMAFSLPSHDKCVIYGPEILLRQSHVIKLAISPINFMWQGLSLILFLTSYHRGLMLIVSSLLEFSNKKARKWKKTAFAFGFCKCIIKFFSQFIISLGKTHFNSLILENGLSTRCFCQLFTNSKKT